MKRMYMDIICCRTGDALPTGMGAIFSTDEETKGAFESWRFADAIAMEEGVDFLLDLHEDNEDLVDTICLTTSHYRQITGEEPPCIDKCRCLDRIR